MNKPTQINIDYRSFTDQIKDLMVVARINANAVADDGDSYFAMYYGRSCALFQAWQIACGGDYEPDDARRLAELLV